MNRRTILEGLAALPWASNVVRAAEAPPWRMALIGGSLMDGQWLAGVRIDLDTGWDTYWRMPGDAGIPPSFDWKNSKRVAGVEVLYPLPQRFKSAVGETVGYQNQVIFPVRVRPAGDGQSAELALNLFFAICKDICIPAKARSSLSLGAGGQASSDDEEVASWLKRVPAAGTPVLAVTAEGTHGQVLLVVKLEAPAIDIFAESESAYYFRKPSFSPDGLEARIVVEGLEDPRKLQGQALKLTVAMDTHALEQQVTVA